jgi:ribosome-associated protein
MDRHGVLSVTSRSQRSQAQNRDAAVARLHELVNEALRTPKPRRKTHVPKAAIEARLESKRRRSETKRKRKPATPDD